MNLATSVENFPDHAILHVDGRIDTVTADAVAAVAVPLAENEKNRRVILDFAKVPYLSSAGLRVVFQLIKLLRQGGRENGLFIAGPNQIVMDVFKTVGFDRLINFRDTVKDCLS